MNVYTWASFTLSASSVGTLISGAGKLFHVRIAEGKLKYELWWLCILENGIWKLWSRLLVVLVVAGVKYIWLNNSMRVVSNGNVAESISYNDFVLKRQGRCDFLRTFMSVRFLINFQVFGIIFPSSAYSKYVQKHCRFESSTTCFWTMNTPFRGIWRIVTFNVTHTIHILEI